jgi:hypothetical protein
VPKLPPRIGQSPTTRQLQHLKNIKTEYIMAQNGNPISRPQTQIETIETTLHYLVMYRPTYPNQNQTLKDIADDDSDLEGELEEATWRHKKLYDSAVAALEALVEMQKLEDSVTKADVQEMGEGERENEKTSDEAVVGKMQEVLEEVEGMIGYECPDNYIAKVREESVDEEVEAGDGGAVRDP